MWTPTPWRVLHGVKKTVDVGPVLQELTSRPGWVEGNAVMLLIGKESDSGPGTRVAESHRSAFPSLTYSFVFSGLEIPGYAPPVQGTLSLAPGASNNRCVQGRCVQDAVQGQPPYNGHANVLTTQACADLCDNEEGCRSFEYHPW